MRISPIVLLASLVTLAGPVSLAQRPSGPPLPQALTLDDAIGIALQRNPGYLQSINNVRGGTAQVRSAYAALLPSLSSSFQTQYQQAGQQLVQGVQVPSSADAMSSQYYLGLGMNLSAGSLFAPKAAQATRAALEANSSSSAAVLRSNVTQQYIQALEAAAQAAVQDTLVITAQGQLGLANARIAAGAGTVMESGAAEVSLAQAQVNALTQHNVARVEKIKLFQQMGVAQPREDVELTTQFAVTEPAFTLDSLLDLARRVNPALKAFRSTATAASAGVRLAQTAYTPSLRLSTGLGGTGYQYADPSYAVDVARAREDNSRVGCIKADSVRSRVGLVPIDCNQYALGADDAARIRAANSGTLYRFARTPLSVSALVTLPVFNNYAREQQLQQAMIVRDNAALDVRGRELQLSTDVSQAYLNLVTAEKAAELQRQIAIKTKRDLFFAEEQYRAGVKTFLDVTVARGSYEQAQIAAVTSVYEYHKAFATLESAVGKQLR
jgi:outer membrane protein